MKNEKSLYVKFDKDTLRLLHLIPHVAFLFIFLIFSISCSFNPEKDFIRLGSCVIYYQEDAPPSVALAAGELQKYIELSTGKKLPVVNRPVTPMISLGDNE